jgi:hypothetical protein
MDSGASRKILPRSLQSRRAAARASPIAAFRALKILGFVSCIGLFIPKPVNTID